MPPLPPPASRSSTAVLAPIYDINWSACSFGNYPDLVKVPGSRCYQFYLTQTEEARYLKEILEDHVKFSTFPRCLNVDVIVDCHPDYPPITPQESDSNITKSPACLPDLLWKLCFTTSGAQTLLVREWYRYLFYNDTFSADYELRHPGNNSSYS